VAFGEQLKPIPPRKRLTEGTRAGGITLVLGAGISRPRGIPSWDGLARAVWRSAFKNRPSPWVANNQGWSPRELPQFLPIIFELAYRELGERRFSKLLTESLYAHARFPSDDANFHRSSESLAVIARLLVAEQRRGSKRRITNVVTLNADDLVENAVSRIVGRSSPMAYGGVVRPVARSLHSFLGATHRIVPLYHIHGFLQSGRMSRRNARMLVFTDSQYWSTSASAFSFANRIMTSALSEGRCVFVGLSMTDINLLRWFALRTLDRDRESYDGMKYIPREHWDPTTEFGAERYFDRHFWIRPDSDDPGNFYPIFCGFEGFVRSRLRAGRTTASKN